jgi:hypothetical protein
MTYYTKGQFLYIDPQTNMIIVRFGKYGGDGRYWTDLFTYLAGNLH